MASDDSGLSGVEAAPRCYRHPDRETFISCSSCERPICTSCSQHAAVGLRCPECSGVPTGIRRATGRLTERGGTPYVTYGLIAVNVIVYFAEAAQGIGLRGTRGSSVICDGAVYGPAIADGEWWRLLTAGFIHAGLVHLAFNMIALWWLGPALEGYLGS